MSDQKKIFLFCVSKINATQGLAALYELALRARKVDMVFEFKIRAVKTDSYYFDCY